MHVPSRPPECEACSHSQDPTGPLLWILLSGCERRISAMTAAHVLRLKLSALHRHNSQSCGSSLTHPSLTQRVPWQAGVAAPGDVRSCPFLCCSCWEGPLQPMLTILFFLESYFPNIQLSVKEHESLEGLGWVCSCCRLVAEPGFTLPTFLLSRPTISNDWTISSKSKPQASTWEGLVTFRAHLDLSLLPTLVFHFQKAILYFNYS